MYIRNFYLCDLFIEREREREREIWRERDREGGRERERVRRMVGYFTRHLFRLFQYFRAGFGESVYFDSNDWGLWKKLFWTARFWGLSAHMIDISCTHSWCSYGIYFESSHRVAYISFSILFLLMDLDQQLVFIYFGSVGKVTSFGFRPNKIDITRCSGASTANYMYHLSFLSMKWVSA